MQHRPQNYQSTEYGAVCMVLWNELGIKQAQFTAIVSVTVSTYNSQEYQLTCSVHAEQVRGNRHAYTCTVNWYSGSPNNSELSYVHEIPGPITRVLHYNLTRRSVSKRTAWSRARLHLIGYTPAGRGRLLADLYHWSIDLKPHPSSVIGC